MILVQEQFRFCQNQRNLKCISEICDGHHWHDCANTGHFLTRAASLARVNTSVTGLLAPIPFAPGTRTEGQ